jgi:hypothetical protein
MRCHILSFYPSCSGSLPGHTLMRSLVPAAATRGGRSQVGGGAGGCRSGSAPIRRPRSGCRLECAKPRGKPEPGPGSRTAAQCRAGEVVNGKMSGEESPAVGIGGGRRKHARFGCPLQGAAPNHGGLGPGPGVGGRTKPDTKERLQTSYKDRCPGMESSTRLRTFVQPPCDTGRRCRC